MSAALTALLDGGRVWRGAAAARVRATPTGFAALDARLPGGGWPQGALSEVLFEQPGSGELSLALPLLARLTQSGQRVALIAPPFIPYAPALAQAGVELTRVLVAEPAESASALWAAEQLLRAGAGAVLAWSRSADLQALRRLQLAAESADNLALLYRPARAAPGFSPTALRLRVWRKHGLPRVDILKCRGGQAAAQLSLSRAA